MTYICNACGGYVKFIDRKPHNEDGSEHWDICKQRQFEKIKKHGTPYHEENESGYIYKDVRFPTWKRGPLIEGSEYKNDLCDCGLPPWELCREDCGHRI